jgi:hypothetical protein
VLPQQLLHPLKTKIIGLNIYDRNPVRLTTRRRWLRLRNPQIGQERAHYNNSHGRPSPTAHLTSPSPIQPDGLASALGGSLALEPDRHTGLEARRIAYRIEAHAERVAVMIADSTLGLPSRKRAKRRKLGNYGRFRFASR